MYELIIQPEAINDIENAATWYAKQQYGLDNRFKEKLFTAIEKLQSDKIIYGPYSVWRFTCKAKFITP